MARWLLGHWSEVAIWLMIVAYIAFFGTFTALKHQAFQTTAFDLGNVDQAVWNTQQGRPLAMTNIEGLTNRLGTHVEPILLPISVLYFLWSDPRLLLLLQTVIIALGAWPVYLLSMRIMSGSKSGRRQADPFVRVLGVVFSFVYLMFPALQSANLFDFHAVALAPTFFLFAVYYLETERWGAYSLFALLTMSCKEDMPLLVAMLGLYAIVVRRRWIVGLVTIGVALAWFLVAVGWIMPHFDTRGVSPFANRYAYLGDGPLEMAVTLATRPGQVLSELLTLDNLAYLRDLLSPVAFLSLLAPQVLVMALPTLLVNLLSTDGFMHQLEGFHYGVILAPVVVVSAAHGAAWLLRRFGWFRPLPLLLSALVLASSLLYHCSEGYTPLASGFEGSWPVVTDHHLVGEQVAEGIPSEASLAALPYLNPHASQRQELRVIDHLEDGVLAPLDGADLVWLDVTNSWPLHPNDLKTGVENLLSGSYGVAAAANGWLLLERDATEREIPDSFFDVTHVTDPRPQYPMHVRFFLDGVPVLETLGFDLELERGCCYPHALVSTLHYYWRALEPLPHELRLNPFYVDDATGVVLEDATQRPTIYPVWYPPEDWQVGEVLKTSTLPSAVGRNFSVGLGVYQGDDWHDVSQRLAIRVESSEQVIRLFDGDTWARLVHVEGGEPIQEGRGFSAPSPQHAVDADLDGRIRLLGYDLERIDDDAIQITLYWQAQRRLDTSYTIFAQMLGPDGQVRSQVDTVPRDGSYLSTWWLPGEIIADPIVLELPKGASGEVKLRVIAGLYDATTGARLPVVNMDQDYVELDMAEP